MLPTAGLVKPLPQSLIQEPVWLFDIVWVCGAAGLAGTARNQLGEPAQARSR